MEHQGQRPATYYAHTPNHEGVWHLLKDHLQGTAALARTHAEKFGAADLAYQAGLHHDIGKYQVSFQDYLRACARDDKHRPPHGPPHAPVGASVVAQQNYGLGFVVWGHHAGLPSRTTLRRRLSGPEFSALASEVLDSAQREGVMGPSSRVPLPSFVQTPYDVDVFLRMLFSTVIDADRLDTERHDSADQASQRGTYPSVIMLQQRLVAHADRLCCEAPPTPINRLRAQIYQTCRAAATGDPGVYRLTVPTGGGKTISGLAFALDHALAHQLDRVIVAIPYTSIIEQTADVYRQVLGTDAVVEHHSTVVDADGDQEMSALATRRRLAADNWDAPLIVTTTVQLFESLFSNRPGACRKLHNLTRSVLVLDEVQALPPHLLTPVLSMLNTLVQQYEVTVVLSTATQPAFEGQSPYLTGFPTVRDIVADPGPLFRELRRVDYDVRPDKVSWVDLAAELRSFSSTLVILNTRSDALRILELLGDPDALHLSTLLCPAHRRDVLTTVTRRLKAGQPCRLVATQVVEAGVNLDFPTVFRANGPLDRIVQAAGRCNREGRQERGRVVIFTPEQGHSPPGPYQTAAAHAEQFLRAGADLHDPDTFRDYFTRVFADLETDTHRIQQARADLDFPSVSDSFRMIEGPTASCIVRYPPQDTQVDGLLRRLKDQGPSRALRRSLAPYEVSIYESDLREALRHGLATEVDEGLYLWQGHYDARIGIRHEFKDPRDLIV